ncbi:MAG: glycosyltransferase [Pseudomonadota bacterium]
MLREMGAISKQDLSFAEQRALRSACTLSTVLTNLELIDEADLLRAQGIVWQARPVDVKRDSPDSRLLDELGAGFCLRHSLLPWRRIGAATVVVTSQPEEVERLQRNGQLDLGPVLIALAPRDDIAGAIVRLRSRQMARAAETALEDRFSCRRWPIAEVQRFVPAALLLCVSFAFVAPLMFVQIVLALSLITLVLSVALKLAAAIIHLMSPPKPPNVPHERMAARPTISMLIPLLKESEIADRLLVRLTALTYPKEALDICLVVEEGDQTTLDALDRTDLPPWIRVVVVPEGSVRTKPRALNFAMEFCRGSIVGIWDAEDAPEPGQLEIVASAFETADPDVACLQGVLDYYNPTTNWLSRCFTIEYATWFRIILPGLQRLGFPIPLGGTTLFLRREAIEKAGGWDAHNVTEDADLGVRLARRGYRTETVSTVTMEEANCRPWPWIKQRSRWLKGYAMTYAVHMRSPRVLYRDLGAWRFFGIQVIFLAGLTQFLMAPLLWSFWPALFGFWHPFQGLLATQTLFWISLVFVGSEILSWLVSTLAISRTRNHWLWPFVPTLVAYYPLAVLAAYKGFAELARTPFHWHKTEHGVFQPKASVASSDQDTPEAAPLVPAE